MDLIVTPEGRVRAIYNDNLDLAGLGQVSISRASHVEPASGERFVTTRTSRDPASSSAAERPATPLPTTRTSARAPVSSASTRSALPLW